MSELDGGVVCFTDPTDKVPLGTAADDRLSAKLDMVDPSAFYGQLAVGGSLGFAESYLQSHWHSDDLVTLLRILCRNLDGTSGANSLIAGVSRRLGRISGRSDRNTANNSRRNVAAHYDLSNEFFALFLDPTLMYSSAYFESEASSLHDGSIAKLRRLCHKLDLRDGQSVLEIGTGWGGLALHMLEHYHVDLTTTTISPAQFAKTQERIEAAGMGERVQLLDADYRDLKGQFDKIVSIEMVEAVGEHFLDTYFRQCGRLLKPGGRIAIQAIVMPEDRYTAYRQNIDFIQKYIFPGGFLPSIAAIQTSVGRTSNLRLQGIEDLSEHYARTLQEWRERFLSRVEDVRLLGFDDRFIRMWEYYLCYCEAAFREQKVRVVQIVWDKPLH